MKLTSLDKFRKMCTANIPFFLNLEEQKIYQTNWALLNSTHGIITYLFFINIFK